jgi:hypothetical protein
VNTSVTRHWSDAGPETVTDSEDNVLVNSPAVAPVHAGQPGAAAADSAPGSRASAYQGSPALQPLQSPPLPSSVAAPDPDPVAAAPRVPHPVDSAS